AFRKMLLELDGSEKLYTIELEAVSIVERMTTVLEILNTAKKPVPFRELVSDPTSKGSVIGTFCALLELCKRQVINVVQEEACGDIGIQLANLDLDISEVTSAIQTSEFETEAEEDDAVVHG
ncbi:MAG: segregation/condensation protein A, partial [Bdellovibrionales bacterium]|nr:segregation/condensation protein A [Bdellovibrionales bacterium]